MLKKVALTVLIAAMLVMAVEAPRLSTPNPMAGDNITWTAGPFDRPASNPVLLVAVYLPDTTLSVIVPGKVSGEEWQFTYEIPRDAIFMAYKTEDDNGTLVDEKGAFFGVPVYDESGNPKFDANFYAAMLYLNSPKMDTDKAHDLLELEYKNYPMNWGTLLFLRQYELSKGNIGEAALVMEMDSLIAAQPDSLEALYFITMQFKLTSPTYFNDGELLMVECAKRFPGSPYWKAYEGVIYNSLRSIQGNLDFYESTVFPLLEGEARESGYLMLLSNALESRNLKRVDELIAQYYKEFPSGKLPLAVEMTVLQSKYSQPNSDWAAGVENLLKRYPSDVDLNMTLAYYYRDLDWKKALGFYRSAIKNSDAPQPAIEFAEIAMQKGKNLAEAKKYLTDAISSVSMDRYRSLLIMGDFMERHKILMANWALLYGSLGWLGFKAGDYETALNDFLLADSFQTLIPGYEKSLYERMLEVSEKSGNLQGRKIALLNLLASDPENTEYLSSLSDIYTIENGSSEGFDDWLNKESERISLRFRLNQTVTDFPLITRDKDTVALSEFKGKVIVLNFWATWCGPCKQEMPELNKLAESYKDSSDVVFIAITNENPVVVASFLEDNKFGYPVYFEMKGMEASRVFNIDSVPTHLVIDRHGYLQFQHVGYIPEITSILTFEINGLLKEK